MSEDPRALHALLEESQDRHLDSTRSLADPMAELLEIGHPRHTDLDDLGLDDLGDPEENLEFAASHRRSLSASLGGATVLGAAGGAVLLGLLAAPAFAASSPDVQMLQTAASIETLAVSTYRTALTLPYIGGSAANPVVQKFAQVTMAQHAQHKVAFNAAVVQLGGKRQNKPDPAFVPVVQKAVAGLSGATAARGAAGVVGLALELENIAAETYVNDVSHFRSTHAKAVTASIMGVEAQHAAVLRAVQALLAAGAPQLIALSPTVVAQLPAAAGSVGFPDAFYPIANAAPAKQGAVK
jgi:hypothetical protein